TAGAGHVALVEDIGYAGDREIGAPLQRMDCEGDALAAGFTKAADVNGVDGRSMGAGVDFGFDAVDAELRQRDPFPPANPDAWFRLRRHIGNRVQGLRQPGSRALGRLLRTPGKRRWK